MGGMKSDIQELTREILDFIHEREWDQFHNPKDLAMALSIEASELLEVYLWKNPEEGKVQRAKEELADILIYAVLFAEQYGFDLHQIVTEKLAENAKKYPVEKAKGVAKNYNEL